MNEFMEKIWSECIKPLWPLIKSQFSRGSREYAYIITDWIWIHENKFVSENVGSFLPL